MIKWSSSVTCFIYCQKKGRSTKPMLDKGIRLDMIGRFLSEEKGTCELPRCTGKVSVFYISYEVHLCCKSKGNWFLIPHKIGMREIIFPSHKQTFYF